jgi:hypothetical protein
MKTVEDLRLEEFREPEEKLEPQLPPWRRATLGWIGVHLLIGSTAISFVQGFIFGFGATLFSGSDGLLHQVPPYAWLLAMLTSMAGWLSFVYLRRPPRTRWVSLSVIVAAGVVVLVSSAVARGPVLQHDDFAYPDGLFYEGSDEQVALSYDEGEYRFVVKDPSIPHVSVTALGAARPQVRIEATMRFEQGTAEASLAGVSCWDGDDGYALVLAPSGEAGLVFVSTQEGKGGPLTDPYDTRSRPLDGPMPLRLDCTAGGRGPEAVTGWVAGHQIASVEVDRGLRGFDEAGLLLVASEPDTVAWFDDFAVRTDPGPQEAVDPPIARFEESSL